MAKPSPQGPVNVLDDPLQGCMWLSPVLARIASWNLVRLHSRGPCLGGVHSPCLDRVQEQCRLLGPVPHPSKASETWMLCLLGFGVFLRFIILDDQIQIQFRRKFSSGNVNIFLLRTV